MPGRPFASQGFKPVGRLTMPDTRSLCGILLQGMIDSFELVA
jgi:hypothetical protein